MKAYNVYPAMTVLVYQNALRLFL